ncbi:MAG: glycosyltransferase 87 family protein [Thermanaerothrix sp.]|nr:glycosyltransferase 87 family protein [Thermanaerothrix sp.]
MKRPSVWVYVFGSLLLIGFLCLLLIINLRLAATFNLGTELLEDWQSARLLLQQGVSPYSSEAAQQIARTAADLGLNAKIVGFNAPLYALILYLPLAIVKDFNLARALAMVLAELSIGLAIYLGVRMTTWRPKRWVISLWIVMGLIWFPGLVAILSGSTVSAVLLVVTLALWAIRTRRDELAGVALGLATVRPHVVGVVIGVIFIWAVLNRRGLIVMWFFITLALLSLLFALFLPSWPLQYLAMIINRQRPLMGQTLGEAIGVFFPGVGVRLGQAVSGFTGALILIELILSRRSGVRAFLWLAALSQTLTAWSGVRFQSQDMVLFLPALILASSLWVERWQRLGLWVALIAMAGLAIGSWGMASWRLTESLPEQSLALLMLTMPLVVGGLLYWVRWWAIRPPSVWLELIQREDLEPLD